ncbi:hypothetical protein [Methylocystis heyeri]|uniref:Uncharacterized protein n=1 Tax=Methylocystis heyeri TaxID=391905 RepID=A0A6B8KM83_9HYPH|nr:hypothetical protein [Methylocystis heyeri]QGM48255.1 hypothetical protein H2LOC_020940 [Methylocystis heyeri]
MATRCATETVVTISIVIAIPLLLDRRSAHLRRHHLDWRPAGSARSAGEGIARGNIRRDGFHRP